MGDISCAYPLGHGVYDDEPMNEYDPAGVLEHVDDDDAPVAAE